MHRLINKLVYTPIVIATLVVGSIIATTARANNDIFVFGQLWETGMSYWGNGVSVEPGQEFKITLFAGNYSGSAAVTSVNFVDALPTYTDTDGSEKAISYVSGQAFQILDNSGNWQALADDGTSPFDNTGLTVTADGTLSSFEFANYKYTVKVPDVLPSGTTFLTWNGPTLTFTDSSGVQTKGNAYSTTITVENVPTVSNVNFSSATTYKVGDVISVTTQGTSGLTGTLTVGSNISVTATESPAGTYTASYTVQAGDDVTNVTPRFSLLDANNRGIYTDASSAITIDATAPPAPSGAGASLNGDSSATLTWAVSTPETDVANYRVYSNNGSGAVDYSTPITTLSAGTTTYTTPVLTADVLYRFVVRAVDAAGNEDGNTTEATVSTDVTPPDAPASLIGPFTATTTPMTFSWDASPSNDVARYILELSVNNSFTPIFLTASTTATSHTLTSPDISTDGVYYWRVFAVDGVENISTSAQTSPQNSFELDTTNPAITVTTPVAGNHIAGNFTVTGTASDPNTHLNNGTGIQKVETFLQNFSANPKEYWNGSAWTTTVTWNTATTTDAFTNWSYDYTATITNGNTYILGSRVTDNAGNTKDSTSFITLTGNTSNPTAVVTSPTTGQFIGGAITVSGTASDPGGSTIASVGVSIQRNSDSQYWNGSAWVGTQTFNSATTANSFANWSYSFSPDFSAADNTVYTIVARATDGVFGTPNTGDSAAVTITKDQTNPTITITSPTAGSSPYNATSWDTANPIQGTGTDATSGIASVQVAIRDSANNYWDGSSWVATTTVQWLSATSADNFANWEYRPGSADFVPSKNDTFAIFARGTDNALGTANTSAQGSGTTVVYDTVAPAFANVTITNQTFGNNTSYVKNGDVFVLTANITDALQSGMSVSSITANISALTGNGGDTAVQPASYATSTGLATWNFATVAGTTNGAVTIIINASDPAGNASVSNTTPITADNTAPAIQTSTLSVPSASGITFKGNATSTITWNAGDITDSTLSATPLTFAYSTDGTNWTTIATNEANDGTFDWAVPAIDSNTVQFRMTVTDGAGNTATDTSDNTFTIDSTSPTVPSNALTAPNGGEAWKQGSSQTITWNNAAVTDNFGLASNPIAFEYSTDGTNWVALVSNEANDGSATITVPVITSETVRVRMTVTDAGGNTATEQSDAVFAIGLPPTITQVRAVSDTVLEVTFDKNIAQAGAFANYTATGITATAVATTSTATVVQVTVNSLGTTAFTATDFALTAGTVTDTGNFVNEAQTGITIVDAQKPQVTSSKALSLVGTDYLVVNFSEDMATTSVETIGNYALESPNASSITLTGSTVSYANQKAIIALDSGINLSRGNSYTITLNNQTDLASNAVTTNTTATGTVVSGATITEVVTDPQQDWSGAGFTGTPGGASAADDKFIELYMNDAGLNLANWTIELTATGSTNAGLAGGQAFTTSNYSGAGTFNSTALGDFLVLGNPTTPTSLENNGLIVVKEENGIIVDQVALGTYNDGNASDNAPAGTATASQVYDESVARDKNRTDTNADNSDFHKMRATPGTIDTTAPVANTGSVFPATNALIVQQLPTISIPLTEAGSGVRNDGGVDSTYANQIVFTLDSVTQTVSYDPATQIVTYTPASNLAFGKHTITIDLRDNAGNTNPQQTWDFYIDNFTASVSTNAVPFRFDGNNIDETSGAGEQQTISVSTYGVGFQIIGVFSTDLTDGSANTISNVDIKQSSQAWGSHVDLNGTTQVPLVTVATAGTPNSTPTNYNYTFDMRATIPGITQIAGDYSGTFEFLIVPSY